MTPSEKLEAIKAFLAEHTTDEEISLGAELTRELFDMFEDEPAGT